MFVFLIFLVVPFALLMVVLPDILSRPAEQFERIGHSRNVWIVSVFVLLVIGPVLYLTLAKPKLISLTSDS